MRFEIDNDFILMRKPFSHVRFLFLIIMIEVLRSVPRWILRLHLWKLGTGKR